MGLQSKKSVWQLKKPSGYRTQHWQEFTTDGIRDNRFLFCWALNFSWDNAFFLLVDLLYTLHWRRLSYSRAAPCSFSFFFLRAKMKRTKPASGRKAEYSWVLFQFFLNRFLLSVLSFSQNPPYTSPRKSKSYRVSTKPALSFMPASGQLQVHPALRSLHIRVSAKNSPFLADPRWWVHVWKQCQVFDKITHLRNV